MTISLLPYFIWASQQYGIWNWSTASSMKVCWGASASDAIAQDATWKYRTVCPPHKCIHVPYNFFRPDWAVALHPLDMCKISQLWFALPMQAVWCWVKPGGHLQVNPPRVLTQRNWQLCCLVWHSSRSEMTEKSRRISRAIQWWIMRSHESTGATRFLWGCLV